MNGVSFVSEIVMKGNVAPTSLVATPGKGFFRLYFCFPFPSLSLSLDISTWMNHLFNLLWVSFVSFLFTEMLQRLYYDFKMKQKLNVSHMFLECFSRFNVLIQFYNDCF